MSKLSAALEAREIWMRFTGVNPDTISGDDIRTAMECKNKMLDAAPDALDWIAKALPILKSLRDVTESVPRLGDDGKIDRVYKESLTYLTALIAQAEGQKEMKE